MKEPPLTELQQPDSVAWAEESFDQAAMDDGIDLEELEESVLH